MKTEKDVSFIRNDVKYRSVPLLEGVYKRVKVGQIVGYCHFNQHPGYLLADTLQKHECLDKKCPFLERFDEYPFWETYEKQQIAREHYKQKKKKSKHDKIVQKKTEEEYFAGVLEDAQKIADNLRFPIIIVAIKPIEKQKKYYIINYVSDDKNNEWRKYIELCRLLAVKHKGFYYLKPVKFPDGSFVTMKEWESHKSNWR